MKRRSLAVRLLLRERFRRLLRVVRSSNLFRKPSSVGTRYWLRSLELLMSVNGAFEYKFDDHDFLLTDMVCAYLQSRARPAALDRWCGQLQRSDHDQRQYPLSLRPLAPSAQPSCSHCNPFQYLFSCRSCIVFALEICTRSNRKHCRAALVFTAPCGSSSHSCSISGGCSARGTRPWASIHPGPSRSAHIGIASFRSRARLIQAAGS